MLGSLHGGEVGLYLLGLLGLFLPSGGDGLPLSEELDSTLAVEVAGSPETGLAASEGEHGKRDRNGEVDTNLTALSLVLELSGSVAILSEDSSTITASMIVHKINSLLESIDSNNNHNGSENFLIIDVHAWLNVVNNGGADKVALFKAWDLNSSTVE